MSSMTPDEQDATWARLLRLLAARAEVAAAQLRMQANVVELAGATRRFAACWAESEAREFASHPDLVELNVQLDGYYGPA